MVLLVIRGFSEAQITLMANLTRILLVAQIFFLLSNFITGILQVHQMFIVPALSPIIYNLCIIGSIFLLAPTFGIYGVVYGTVIGALLHFLIQVPVVSRIGFKYNLLLSLRDPGSKRNHPSYVAADLIFGFR